MGVVPPWNDTVPNWIIVSNFHKWIHLVLDMRTDLERIYQVLCKRKSYPYQIHTGSKWIRYHVNAA